MTHTLQLCLIDTIISLRSNKQKNNKRDNLWQLLQSIFQSNKDNSELFETCATKLKGALTKHIKASFEQGQDDTHYQSITIKQV